MLEKSNQDGSQDDLIRQEWMLRQSLWLDRHRQMGRAFWFAAFILAALLLLSAALIGERGRLFDQYRPEATLQQGQLASLQRQLDAVLSSSIASKLRLLEKRMRAGGLATEDIDLVHELRDELTILYTPATLDKRDWSVVPVMAGDEELLQEFATLKNLFYVSIASCGLVLIAMGGLWLRSVQQLRRLAHQVPDYRALPGRPPLS